MMAPDMKGIAAAAGAKPRSSAAVPNDPSGLQRQLWLQEVERAQSSAWFASSPTAAAAAPPAPTQTPPARPPSQPAVVRTPVGRDGSGSTRNHPAASPRPVVPEPLRSAEPASGLPSGPAGASGPIRGLAETAGERVRGANGDGVAGGDKHALPLPALAAGIREALRDAMATRAVACAPHAAAAAPGVPGPAARPAGSPMQVRVHVESRGSALSVWLGVPQGEEGPALPQAPDELLRQVRAGLGARGGQLAQLVVNGRVVWRGAGRDDGWPPPLAGEGVPFPVQAAMSHLNLFDKEKANGDRFRE
ncbi:hypothetical protein [Xenophilus sp.]|uniref:hypothetical protein n=1 Tax=Xenophilus sp. TaxID=1873499 RepID=UPI0037DC9EC6